MLRPDEVPTVNLPVFPTQTALPTPRRILIRNPPPSLPKKTLLKTTHVSSLTNTDLTASDIGDMSKELEVMKDKLRQVENECAKLKQNKFFRVSDISGDDVKVKFYTGFANYSTLMVCFDFLGPSVKKLV
jgi:hypothetical protein